MPLEKRRKSTTFSALGWGAVTAAIAAGRGIIRGDAAWKIVTIAAIAAVVITAIAWLAGEVSRRR